ncbi:AMP-binding protein [Mycobacterium sp. AT1]|uniref:AMP-binding protein n=1 Tax=Mycobacterium sp. AT1 TaxID=1961706 RepID=UPI0009AE2925|nr:AMP-binding protein [Mycobacterium sp. AT1]OPX13246.1 acyl-CoA synthetase [Mycobacterium sp. AT1]
MVFRSPHPDVDIPDVALHDFVMGAAARRFGDKVALVDGDTAETLTYRELHDRVHAGADYLTKIGVHPGDVVAVMSHNQPRFAVVAHAVLSAGAAITPINPMYTADEVAAQLNAAHASVLVTSAEAEPRAVQAAKRARIRHVLVMTGPDAGWLDPTVDRPVVEPSGHVDPVNTVAVLPFSSGTTGVPKGVRLTHRNVVANLVQMRQGWRIQSDDVVLAVLPFFHIYGFTVILNSSLLAGATIVTQARFDRERFLGAVARHRVTRAFFAPPMLLSIAKSELAQRYSTTSLRYGICGAAPLDTDVVTRVEQRLGCRIRQGYGMTEASPGTHIVADDAAADTPSGCVGTLLPNTEARLVAPGTDTDVGPGCAGELLIRGPQVMAGYLDDGAATADAITDGWLRTGDLVRIDAGGQYWIEDRLKELIKYKGYQVAPAELEAVLLTHPNVTDAAVVPVPDPTAGEVPKAFVVLSSPNADLDEVIAYVAQRVAPYKKIRSIEAVETIPKSPTGKILRRLLKDRERLQRPADAAGCDLKGAQ